MNTNRRFGIFAGFTVVAVLAIASLPGVARAQLGALSLWWDVCGSSANQLFHANKFFIIGQPAYTMVMSARDVDSVCRGFETSIQVVSSNATAYPDAWRFDPGGCYEGFYEINNATNPQTCPPFGPQGTPTNSFEYSTVAAGFNNGLFRVQATFPPFDPNPATEYTVFKIRIDASFMVAEPTNPGIDCGEADQELTLLVNKHGFVDENFNLVQWPVGHGQISWNSFNPVPTAPSTWGKLKAAYR